MPTRSPWSLPSPPVGLILIVSAAAVIAAGWFWSSPGPPPAPPPDTAVTDPLLEGWKQPAVTLVLSGEQRGYFEPCGCTELQSGGFSRRADLFAKLRARGWSPIGLDLGGLVQRHRDQSKLKFQTMLAALAEMRYRAVGLGPEDLALGAAFLLSQGQPAGIDGEETSPDSPLMSANVELFGGAEIPGTPVVSRVVTTPDGKEKVGITAILDPDLVRPLREAGLLEDITIRPPADVLPRILDDLEKQGATILVLLSHARLDTSLELARQFPRLHLVLSGGGLEDPLVDNPRRVGPTTVLTVGPRGKYAGVVGFGEAGGVQEAGNTRKVRFELVLLDKRRFADTPAIDEHMRTYQQTLETSRLAANMVPVAFRGGREFVGAERCGVCHIEALATWKRTPHSHAFESLIRGREGQELGWVSRAFDPECLACHVTGWHPRQVLPYTSGYVDQQASGHLLGNQCENCHGAGSRHVELIEAERFEEARAEVRVSKKQARTSVCIGCHDVDNSPKFDFHSYWDKVKHYGLD